MTGNTQTWEILSPNPTDGLGQGELWEPLYEAPDNLQVENVECVSLAILYLLFFSVSLVLSMLHHSSVGWFYSKKCYFTNFLKRGSFGLKF